MTAINVSRTPWRGLGSALVLFLGLAVVGGRAVRAQVNITGQWQTLPYQMPINPIHLALLNNGKVLVVAGSGNVENVTDYEAALWDPQTGTIATKPLSWDMFCNGMVVLPDGRVFINGGTLHYLPFYGLPKNAVYDPATDQFTDVQDMAHGRWYPTPTTLGDGRVISFSGLDENGSTNTTVEVYTPGAGWSPEYPAGWTPPLYPRMHLLPNGLVFYSGSTPQSRFFNPSTNAWTGVVTTTNYSGTRLYGSSVLLPLTPTNNYRPRVMIFGGDDPATNTTELVDLSSANPKWISGPTMAQARIDMNATLLPNGTILVSGGSSADEDAVTAAYAAEIYDPATNAFRPAGSNAFPRLYHSGSLLLPDATVVLLGGNPVRGSYEPHLERYTPPYLFNSDGTAAARPSIASVTSAFGYGETFQVQTPDAASIAAAVLIRPGSPTHSFDQDQRLIALSYTAQSGALTLTAPPTANIAPPGYYMLFLINTAGVPSVAKFVKLAPSLAAQRPTATMALPAADATVAAGGSVFFSGSGVDPQGLNLTYSWSFPGGTPASSNLHDPGSVVYSTPGTYVASLTVTNSQGLTSVIPATRVVTVPDFAFTVTPPSRTVLAGGATNYVAGATAGNGFTGTISLGVTGQPAGVTAQFVPASINGSGVSLLNVTTPGTLPLGTYPLTVTATSGNLTHQGTVTLVVSTCTARLALGYTPGTLRMGFTIGTLTPGTWSTWLVAQNTPFKLWSMAIPVVSPAASLNVPLPGIANLGTVLVATVVTNTTTTCGDLQVVNTGP